MHCANFEVILTVWLTGGGGRGAWAWRGMEGIPLNSSLLPQALGFCGRNLLTVLGQASQTSFTGNELEQGLTNHRRAVKVNLQQELLRSAGRQCLARVPAQGSLRICKPHPLGRGCLTTPSQCGQHAVAAECACIHTYTTSTSPLYSKGRPGAAAMFWGTSRGGDMPLQVKGFPSRNKALGLILSTEQEQECWLLHTQNPRTVEVLAQMFQVLGYVKSLRLAGFQESCLELTTPPPKKT